MNKFEYLSKLKNNLMSLPAKEREAAVRYYGNYFDDAGLSNEQDVIASLGSPENLAHKILNNSNKLSLTEKKTKKEVKAVRQKLNSRQTIIAVLLVIFTFPVWGSVIAAAAGIIFGLFIAIAAVLLGFISGGILLFCMGVANIVNVISIGLVLIGVGMILGSIPFLLFLPLTSLWLKLLKGVLLCFAALINKILGKSEVTV